MKDYIKKLKTLTQVIRLVNENYVEEVDMNNILEGAIVGLLDRLDPHSIYIYFYRIPIHHLVLFLFRFIIYPLLLLNASNNFCLISSSICSSA